MEHPPKQGLKPSGSVLSQSISCVLMEHPPKQGLKHKINQRPHSVVFQVLMEHPPKQGLKQSDRYEKVSVENRFNGTSTKTRIETSNSRGGRFSIRYVFNVASTKRRKWGYAKHKPKPLSIG